MGSRSKNEVRTKCDQGDSSGNATGKKNGDEPLQLIEFTRKNSDGNATIKLNHDTIKSIVNRAGSRPLVTICVCGPSRQGKSFILGHMMRCLEALENEETDWMDWDNKSKPLDGFKFRNGAKPETQGIWIWSKPFIVKNDEDREVAVLLIDSQGTNDEFTTTKDMVAIVSLSLLTSSVMIFNCFTNLQEDILGSLNIYTQYGQLALENVKDTPPFQKVIFLIRDWNNPGEYACGSRGGKKFLEEKLKLRPDQPPEASQVRKTIKKCFQELDCFLMPQIGEKALYPDFTGAIGDLAPNFAKKMEDFISNLIRSETLVIKEILGNQITAQDLSSYLETYVKMFNSSEIPSAKKMWEANTNVHNSSIVRKACQKFHEVVNKQLRGNTYVSADVLEAAQTAAMKQAYELFKRARKFCTPAKIEDYQEVLERNLRKDAIDIKKQNEEKRSKYLAGVMNDATALFRTLLEEATPFYGDPSMFYEDSVINREAAQAKATVIDKMTKKMAWETQETIATKVWSLVSMLESTQLSHMNRNKAQRMEAEKKIRTIMEGILSEYKLAIKELLNDNKFTDIDELITMASDTKARSMEAWNKAVKPGRKEFHKGYHAKLEAEMTSIFSRVENEHNLRMQQVDKGIVGDMSDLPGMISSIMEGCKKLFLEDVTKSVNGMEERVKEKLKGEIEAKIRGLEANWTRKLVQLKANHLEEKQMLENKVAALQVANMDLYRSRKMEERKNLDEKKEMEEKIKNFEAKRRTLKDFFCNILEEEIDMDCLEDKMPRVLAKIKEINDRAKKLEQIQKIVADQSSKI